MEVIDDCTLTLSHKKVLTKKKTVVLKFLRVEFEYHDPVLELSLSTTIPFTQTQLMTKPTLYSTQLVVIGEGPVHRTIHHNG